MIRKRVTSRLRRFIGVGLALSCIALWSAPGKAQLHVDWADGFTSTRATIHALATPQVDINHFWSNFGWSNIRWTPVGQQGSSLQGRQNARERVQHDHVNNIGGYCA